MANFWSGTPGSFQALPTLSGEQSGMLGQLLSMLQGPMQSGMGNLSSMLSGDTSAFEAPAMRQFQEEIIPGIAERFTGMGAGAQSSSAFQQALGSAGAGLAENLAMQKAGLQQQGMGNLMQLLQMGLGTPTFQWGQIPGQEGMGQSLMKSLGSGIGQFGGTLGSMYGMSKLLPLLGIK